MVIREDPPPSADVIARFYALITEVFGVRRHIDLMRWLQGDLQQNLPHDILIAAWGDFRLGVVYYDVISTLPGARSESTLAESITPLLTGLFHRWLDLDRAPFSISAGEDSFEWHGISKSGPIAAAMQGMRSALVHGINDQRGRHDCLYVLLSKTPNRRRDERNALELLLPYIDTAEETPAANDNGALSEREAEIMAWVAKGKTNGEIGSILNVSSFTVKNHMQRIFKKLDVFNRAQAVSTYSNMIGQPAAAGVTAQDA
jgi:transcriptional regulator EpsA